MPGGSRIGDSNARVGLEPFVVFGLGMLGFISWTLYAGPDLNWDLLNYHIYAGLHASGDAIGKDVFGAGGTSYLAPYGYWPLAKMVAGKWPAMVVGSVLAAIHSLAVIVTWYLSKQLFPGDSPNAITLRVAATAVGVTCPLVLTEVGTSFIDITSAIPVVLGIALLMKALCSGRYRTRIFIFSGLCFGVATALKLTGVPFALAAFFTLLAAWCFRPDVGWKVLFLFGCAEAAGFIAGYGYWGFQLWREFGNPFFPLFQSYFQPSESLQGVPVAGIWTHPPAVLSGFWDWLFSSTNRHQRFIPRDIWDWLLRPLYMVDPVANVYTEVRAPDARFLALFCLAPVAVWKVRAHLRTSTLVVLLLFFLVGWIFWMATSGNGRYMMPLALLAGPALVGCGTACWPRQNVFALIAGAIFVFVQAALLVEGTRFRWSESTWQDYWISAKLPHEVVDYPVTFVTFDGQSASWLSAFVHPGSRFANPGGPSPNPAAGKVGDRFPWVLEHSRDIVAIFRFTQFEPDGETPFPSSPSNRKVTAAQIGLDVDFNSCVTGNLVQADRGRTIVFGEKNERIERIDAQGYFFCHATYRPELKKVFPLDPLREATFGRVERACPGQFPPGGAQTICAADTCWRTYTTADTNLIIRRDGAVIGKYYGAFQEPYFGTVEELSGDASKISCQADLGRYAPWSPGANLFARRPLPRQ